MDILKFKIDQYDANNNNNTCASTMDVILTWFGMLIMTGLLEVPDSCPLDTTIIFTPPIQIKLMSQLWLYSRIIYQNGEKRTYSTDATFRHLYVHCQSYEKMYFFNRVFILLIFYQAHLVLHTQFVLQSVRLLKHEKKYFLSIKYIIFISFLFISEIAQLSSLTIPGLNPESFSARMGFIILENMKQCKGNSLSKFGQKYYYNDPVISINVNELDDPYMYNVHTIHVRTTQLSGKLKLPEDLSIS